MAERIDLTLNDFLRFVPYSQARLDASVHYGFLESSFLLQLLNKDRSLMEPKADLCRKVGLQRLVVKLLF